MYVEVLFVGQRSHVIRFCLPLQQLTAVFSFGAFETLVVFGGSRRRVDAALFGARFPPQICKCDGWGVL